MSSATDDIDNPILRCTRNGAAERESSGGRGTDRTHHAVRVLTHNQLWAYAGLQVYLGNRVSVLQSRVVSRSDTVV